MVDKRYLMFAFLIVGIFLSLSLVSAFTVSMNITLPTNNSLITFADVSNYSTAGQGNASLVFNVTFMNATSEGDTTIINTTALTALNATFFYNLSGTWTQIGSNVSCYSNPTADQITNMSCSGAVDVTAVKEGRWSINVTILNPNGTRTQNFTPLKVLQNVTFNLIPNVSLSGLTRTHGANLSGEVVINFTVDEYFRNLGSVRFNVSNFTAGGKAFPNWTYTPAREGSTDYYSLKINTTWFPDGIYNITIIANDTFGEVNDTTIIRNLKFDNTIPSVTLAKLNSNRNSLNATITVTDATSGPSQNITCTTSRSGGNPTISGTGGSQNLNEKGLDCGHTYKYIVSCVDEAGNAGASSEGSFETDSCAGTGSTSGGTSGGDSSGTSGTSATPSVKESFTFTEVKVGEETIATDFDEDIGVEEIKMSVTETATNVRLKVDKYDSQPTAVSTPKSGKVYKYLEITADNVGEKLEKATIKIKVEKVWVDSAGIDSSDIAMFKLVSGEWIELSTALRIADTDDTAYYYDVETDTFSYFAIGQKEASIEEPTGGEVGGEAGAKNLTWLWWTIGIVVVIAIALGIGVGVKKKK